MRPRNHLSPDLFILLAILTMGRLLGQAQDGSSLRLDSPGEKCSQLADLVGTDLPNHSTVILSAELVADGREGQPEHCRILGKINERIGFDSQHYAIRFHLRLPTTWNGSFYFDGGGGTNGNLGDAVGYVRNVRPRVSALSRGYAVVSQDAGHDNNVNNDPSLNGTQTFGYDAQARLDYGYNSYDQVTQTAKALVAAYYGRPAGKSYYAGCSEGGREGMMMSQRFPSYFDGIVSMAPGFTLPKASVLGESWDTQAFAAVARDAGIYDRDGQPFLNKTFTDDDLVLVANAILAACDSLDGLADELIQDFPACTTTRVKPELEKLECRRGKNAGCLTRSQLVALERVFEGVRNSSGELLYATWPWDAGLGGKVGDSYYQGWRRWKIGTYDSTSNSAINVNMGAGAALAIFTTPPTITPGYGPGRIQFQLNFNFDIDTEKIYATSAGYEESAWDFMMASSTDLSGFRDRGGKLVIIHGVSDPIFSINDTIRWWKEVDQANGGRAADFVRVFAVPGMAHCSGGPATDQFDSLSAVVDWVEKGMVPDSILATAGDQSPWPNRTRPLCAFPKQARYKGQGSTEDARNFECVVPADGS